MERHPIKIPLFFNKNIIPFLLYETASTFPCSRSPTKEVTEKHIARTKQIINGVLKSPTPPIRGPAIKPSPKAVLIRLISSPFLFDPSVALLARGCAATQAIAEATP